MSPTLAQAEPPSRTLARFAAGLSPDAIPAAVLERAKLHVLDALGVGLASCAYEYGRRAVSGGVALGSGKDGACSVLGRSERLDVRDAALVNGILIHGLDFDDTHLASIVHPTCTSLPGALALAESRGASGRELLTAFLAGAEAAIRIGGAARGGFHEVGFHATGVVSHFASALAAGKLIGLDEEQLVAAQGIAGSTASGIQVFLEEGAWTKRFHPGWGAVAGITAAQLAGQGFRAPTRPYEGRFGLFETHLAEGADRVDLDELSVGLGEDWRFRDTALKPYPACHFIHGCADAALDLHGELAGRQIVAVDAFLPEPTLHIVAEPAEAKRRPTTDYEAKFSAPFVVATCLRKGRFGLAELQPEAIADPEVQELSARVRCRPDPESAFPSYFSGGVEVTLDDGGRHRRHVRVNRGAGERALDAAEVTAKFLGTAGLAVSQVRAERIRDAVLRLEEISVPELTALLREA